MAKNFDLDRLLRGDDNLESIKTTLLTVASMSRNPKVARVINVASLGISVGQAVHGYVTNRNAEGKYRIKISDSDPLFLTLQDMLIKALPEEEKKNLVVSSKRSGSGASMSEIEDLLNSEEARPTDFLHLFYDGERKQSLIFNGHEVTVFIGGGNPEGNPNRRPMGRSSVIVPAQYIYVEANTAQARDAVLDALTEQSRKAYARRPRYYTAQKWGNFRATSDVPVRPLDSVVLREGQVENILFTLKTFLSREQEYINLGIPWHFGMLFYGPPGTGKTSIATTIASSLNLDVFTLSLSAIEDDNTLWELLAEVTPRSILLIEDIDVASAARNRNDERSGVTLSGLLNGLDGVATPHGLITIMTTNHYENLDEALIRPGRVDMQEEIGYLDNYQAQEICRQFAGFIPENLPFVSEDHKIVPANVIDLVKKHLGNPQAIGEAIAEYLTISTKGNKYVTPRTTRKAQKDEVLAEDLEELFATNAEG